MFNSLTLSALLNILTDEREKELLNYLVNKHYGSNFLTNREDLESRILELLDKYGELSWAGSQTEEDLQNPLVLQKYNSLKETYPADIEKLEGPEGYWWRGFIIGLLSCCNLLSTYVVPENFVQRQGEINITKEELIAIEEENFLEFVG